VDKRHIKKKRSQGRRSALPIGNHPAAGTSSLTVWASIWASIDWVENMEETMGRGILLWLLGVPIPVIIILALLWH
jgi:hypothetical protein